MNTKHIVVAGASGFIGKSLIERLLLEFPDVTIVALSRSPKESQNPRLIWKNCDLFSEESIAKALPTKIDLAYYLVHSMEPTAQLDQGSFADYDLIMADNFARACKSKVIHQLVYLGGLIPSGSKLSLHLRSRLEVEEVFEEHKIPHTFLRAGLILGENGSSFQILLKLVRRLKVMICPTWTQTLTSPVDLQTVLNTLVTVATIVTQNHEHLGRTYDLAGCRPLTYIDMMKLTAQHLGLKRFFIQVPLFSITLSRLWVSLVTNTSKYLVYPLIESLQHPMVARATHNFYPESSSIGYIDLLKSVSVSPHTRLKNRNKVRTPRQRFRAPSQIVRSVQRLPVTHLSAEAVAETYFRWLPQLTKNLISVERESKLIKLKLLSRVSLIEFQEIPALSGSDRMTFAICGGLLVREHSSARLEFRLALEGKFVLIAIHDYAPALPWFVYRYTQALIHLGVMSAFRSYLTHAPIKQKIKEA